MLLNPSLKDRIDRLRLVRCPGVGPVTFRRLLREYDSATSAIRALPERLRQAGLRQLSIPAFEPIRSEWEATEKFGARILFFDDDDYPRAMKNLPDAPSSLTVMGNVSLLSHRCVGVVGARNASAAGLRMAESLATGLAAADIVVVSGLALGIDRAAHLAALYPHRTVAALAGGVNTVYPPENGELQAAIANKGCLVTEAPFGTIPQGRHFPRRNRLIAGMSLGVVVVEAGLRSGTMITARTALDYGRDVFAVPGCPLDPRARGGNDLIRQGAILTETVEDILRNLSGTGESCSQKQPRLHQVEEEKLPFLWDANSEISSDPREKIASLLSDTPISVDVLVDKSQFSVSVVSSVLSALELDDEVSFLPDGQVILTQLGRQCAR